MSVKVTCEMQARRNGPGLSNEVDRLDDRALLVCSTDEEDRVVVMLRDDNGEGEALYVFTVNGEDMIDAISKCVR